MIVALIDNGSLEPAAHRQLLAVAAALAKRVGVAVEAVSWKHSDRIPVRALMGPAAGDAAAPTRARSDVADCAWTLAPFLRHHLARGERDLLFVPFFISTQGAIGSALRDDLEYLQREVGDFSFRFTDDLAARGALAGIVADRVRETIAAKSLSRPAVLVVDHGGPSRDSAMLRDAIAAEARALLGTEIASLGVASLEGAEYTHARPLLVEALASSLESDGDAAPPPRLGRKPRRGHRGPSGSDVVVAPLFVSPGRHAGPNGDVARICRASAARCHLTALVGDHPAVIDTLAAALRDALDARANANLPTEADACVS